MANVDAAFTNKHAAWWVATLLGSLAGLGTLHAQYIVPSILREVDRDTDVKIKEHSSALHPLSIQRREYDKDMDLIQGGLTGIDSKLQSIDSRIRQLEQRK